MNDERKPFSEALYASAPPAASVTILMESEQAARDANTGLADEVRILRGLLDDLVDAIDGTNDLDEMDGPEYFEASNRLTAATEAARPHTEKALLQMAIDLSDCAHKDVSMSRKDQMTEAEKDALIGRLA